MNTAKLRIKSRDCKKIYDSLIPEIDLNESVRSSIKMKALNDELLVDFEAKDINALKTVINHVLRLITAYEEAAKIRGEN
ncbi:MAG: KEOPS complex subunit Pcc1 [Candidatus Nanoarchaeia archaeon]|jgi:tRNA threonylcarbamoyladenosine modification (KEOPS) complex  Pcc1 subunit